MRFLVLLLLLLWALLPIAAAVGRVQAKEDSINPLQVDVFISYCVAWQGRGAFDQVKRFLDSRFPNALIVRGASHPPTPMGALANQLSQLVQVSGAVFALAGERIVQALQIAHMPMVRNALENKIQVLGSTFLFSTVLQSMSKTDAFEVYVNGELVFSKLEMKRLPTWEEIARALAKHGLVLDDADFKAHLQRRA